MLNNLKYHFLIILFALCSNKSAAQASILTLNDEDELYNLGKFSSLFIDPSTTLSFNQINTATYQNKFIPFESDALSLGVMPEAVWVKIQVRDPKQTAQKQWLLSLNYPLFDYVTFYQKDDSGNWTRQETGDKFLYKDRRIENRNFVFSLNLPPDSLTVFYLRFQTSGSMQIAPQLYSERAFLKADTLAELGYGLFFGGLLIIMLYNLIMFFSLRDWAYAVYCFHILASIGQQMAFSGHANQFIFDNSLYWTNMQIPLIMIINVLSTLVFSVLFLKTKIFTPFLHKVLMGLIIIGCLHIGAIFYLPLIQSIPFSGMMSTLSLFAVFFAAIFTYKNGNKSARFFLLAWTILIISGLIAGFRLFGILPSNAITIHSIKFGLLLETILLALALADKYNLYRKEKEETQEKMIKLQEDTNRNLEEKVKSRTIELAKTNDKLTDTLEKVKEERKKSDQLLLNILPAETAAELKEKGVSTPKQYHLATVLFTDFKNFTHLVEELPPSKIIEVLGICFLAFDEICERNNIEKIKTIGDSYMAAGGLPIPNISNPIDAVKAALEIQEWMANWDQTGYAIEHQQWEIRTGIHSGPVMAGVVGKNKFAYDIWGDTVNIASRMESTGEVGKVSISKRTYEMVKDYFYCEYRGKVEAKNIGSIDSYWVKGAIEKKVLI